jgi:hypothetical protein
MMLSTVSSNLRAEGAGGCDRVDGVCARAGAAGAKTRSAARKTATLDTLFLVGIMFGRGARGTRGAGETWRRAPLTGGAAADAKRRFIKGVRVGRRDEMRERPADDTTKEPARARPEDERRHGPGGYYYDDGTGYELYDPSDEDPDEELEERRRDEKL